MRSLIGFSAAGLLLLGAMNTPSASVGALSFTIDDSFPAAGGPGVFSDGAGDAPHAYADYRVDESSALNWCVEAQPYSAGNLFIRLNRKLDGDAGVMRCTDNPGPDGPNGVQRNFVLRIDNEQVCNILSDPDAGLPLTDGSDATWQPGSGGCTLKHNDNPRIRLGTLYKARARTTTLDFLTVMFDKPNSYEIRSDAAAPISSNEPGHKAVTYSGTYRLVKFAPGQKTRSVGPSFEMPVSMHFYEQ